VILSAGFYPNPVPGFIFTAVVCAGFSTVAVRIWVREYGAKARMRRAAGDRSATAPPTT